MEGTPSRHGSRGRQRETTEPAVTSTVRGACRASFGRLDRWPAAAHELARLLARQAAQEWLAGQLDTPLAARARGPGGGKPARAHGSALARSNSVDSTCAAGAVRENVLAIAERRGDASAPAGPAAEDGAGHFRAMPRRPASLDPRK